MQHLLFVCTGNTCRSPMAEQIAREMFRRRGLDWKAESAGLYALPGLPMNDHAHGALEQLGIHPEPHAARLVTPEMVRRADVVLAMTSSHAWDLRAGFPSEFDKIHELGVYATTQSNPLSATCDIVDPYGGSLEHYVECAQMLKMFVEAAVDRLVGAERRIEDESGGN